MLSKKQRFTRALFPKGRPNARRSFSWGTASLYDSPSAAAVVVSKKVIKKAHDRNRAKRRVYNVLATLDFKKGLVIHLRKEALTAPNVLITNDLKELL